MAKKFSDIAKEDVAFPNAKYIEDKMEIRNKVMTIKDSKEVTGEKGTYSIVLAELDKKEISFTIGGVVSTQLVKFKTKMPFEAKIIEKKGKNGRLYFTFE